MKNNIINFEEIRFIKKFEKSEIKIDEDFALKTIKFKINHDEIEEIRECIDSNIEMLTDFIKSNIDIEVNQENLEILSEISYELDGKCENKNGLFLKINYYEFEIFLSAIETVVETYLESEKENTEILDQCPFNIKILKKAYDRLNVKYLNIEEKLYPGISEYRRILTTKNI